MRRQGAVVADLSAGLRNLKQALRLLRLLRVDEVIRLLESMPVETAPGLRDRAMQGTAQIAAKICSQRGETGAVESKGHRHVRLVG